jgi:hypothetical protein
MRAVFVNENIKFQKGMDPKDSFQIGNFENYLFDFAEELELIKGKDGFPWESYEDYVVGAVEKDLSIRSKIRACMEDGLSPKECAKELQDLFDEGHTT